ncbi:unnamed protein product, partial [Prorocentrum cordatum]
TGPTTPATRRRTSARSSPRSSRRARSGSAPTADVGRAPRQCSTANIAARSSLKRPPTPLRSWAVASDMRGQASCGSGLPPQELSTEDGDLTVMLQELGRDQCRLRTHPGRPRMSRRASSSNSSFSPREQETLKAAEGIRSSSARRRRAAWSRRCRSAPPPCTRRSCSSSASWGRSWTSWIASTTRPRCSARRSRRCAKPWTREVSHWPKVDQRRSQSPRSWTALLRRSSCSTSTSSSISMSTPSPTMTRRSWPRERRRSTC